MMTTLICPRHEIAVELESGNRRRVDVIAIDHSTLELSPMAINYESLTLERIDNVKRMFDLSADTFARSIAAFERTKNLPPTPWPVFHEDATSPLLSVPQQ